MQLQEQLCRCRRMLHYKQGLPRGIPSKNLEDTIPYKANKAQVEIGKFNHQSYPAQCLVGFCALLLVYHRL